MSSVQICHKTVCIFLEAHVSFWHGVSHISFVTIMLITCF